LSFWGRIRALPSRNRLIALACALVLVHAGVLGLLRHTPLQSHLSELIQTTLDALCLLACVRASGRSRRFARSFWGLAALSFSILVLAQIIAIAIALTHPESANGQFTEALFLFWFGPLSVALFVDPDSEAKKLNSLIVLDVVQAILFWLAVYLYFSYLMPRGPSGTDLIHSAWNRSLIYNGVLVGAFLLRSVLSNSMTVRSLFGRFGVFLFLSSLADLYFSYPGMNFDSGDWYDLVWSSLLLLPIAMADGWKEPDASGTPLAATQIRDSLGRYMSPLIYALLVFIMCVQIAHEHLSLASIFVLTSFLCSSGRMFLVQRQQERTEGELRQRETQYRRLIENMPEVVWTADEHGNFLLISERIASVFGYTPEEVCREGHQLWFGRLHPEDRERVREAYAKLLSENRPFDVEYRMQHRDGHWMHWHDRAVATEQREGKRYAEGLLSDITERRRLEEQFRQAQKMEAIGQLAGGVAHDFNNLLMVIQGNADVVRERLSRGHPESKNLEEIRKAAGRAASLTRQLLAFSRMQVLNPKILNMNTIVDETGRMLRRLIGEHIELRIVPGAGLMNVKADQGQIEQVLLNLAVNARDAMPKGGRLTIETSVVHVDEHYSHQHHALRRGAYVLLTVSDTGVGMGAETQARIFEPFFTTKQFGKGTGLGLAIVYGVVKQTGGWIWVYSELGQGTAFKVYLPQVNETATQAEQRDPRPELPRGTETVLLAEDQDSIRDLIRESLTSQGYKVLVAKDGLEALQIAERYKDAIDLLITDVVMPKIGGHELAKRLLPVRPETRTLFISGYLEHRNGEDSGPGLSSVCLQKPFSMHTLVHKVREALEAPRMPSGPQEPVGSL
jgi:two-component system, cell cycle sensor histidine kinase and response regulator CckA